MEKSPLRYPGGKSRVFEKIIYHIPLDIEEFREPFVGGGSVFLGFKQTHHLFPIRYWINDLNYDLYCFWKNAKDKIEELVDAIMQFRQKYANGRDLYAYFTDQTNVYTEFDRAVRFFIMNRITFSGVVDSGGYSQKAFEQRFTESSIERLRQISPHLSEVKVTHGDYEKLLFEDGGNVFLFFDPPYWKATKSKLYGVKGDLHTSFDHERFAANLQKCNHRWLITYDDSPKIRDLFSFAKITDWELQYGMNNYKKDFAAKGKELFIKNY
ncbi:MULTISPECIES: DNA adenine methylase [Cyanophyceae]|uniref:DNA adenine methylase n=1 Tax=Cyanophyceae TaxID=3028117 RepID=UPI00168784E1|nr:DNA adenine methylase [Trichocoleus sp. FACHB-40]MBD2003394.1 DNA adenine methylase [Trichocoleus sp. FACHB-40]